MSAVMFVFGLLTVASACGVVFSRNSLHSALWLITTLFFVAAHYALLGAEFVAVLQVMIYAGAIMVLVIFVIMLLGIGEGSDRGKLGLPAYLSGLLCGVFIGVLVYVLGGTSLSFFVQQSGGAETVGSAEAIGRVLFSKFLLPFQVTGVMLLGAIVGAVLLAHEPRRSLPPGRGLRAKREEIQKAVGQND